MFRDNVLGRQVDKDRPAVRWAPRRHSEPLITIIIIITTNISSSIIIIIHIIITIIIITTIIIVIMMTMMIIIIIIIIPRRHREPLRDGHRALAGRHSPRGGLYKGKSLIKGNPLYK